jgi:hypothetical protein
MKTAAISGALIAALAAGAFAIPTVSAAQPYGYAPDCRNDGAAGTVIGGIAGALLGSSLAPHHGNRAGGAAIGGVAGALVGNSIGRSSGCSTVSSGYGYDSYGYANRYPNYGYSSGYSNGYTGYYAQPYYSGSYVVRDGYDNRYRDHDRYDHDRYDRDRHDNDRHDWDRDHYRR